MNLQKSIPLVKNKGALSWILILVLVGLTTLAFLNSPGSGDVTTFQNWTKKLDANGIVRGFELLHDNYPPISLALLWGTAKVARWLATDVFLVFKWSIVLFLFLTSFTFWLWTRNLALTTLLHLALLPNSVALGYVDIYFAPTLILSLWALKERRFTLFAIFYTLSFLTKWQPLIISPFLIIHILPQENSVWQNLKMFASRVALPSAVMLITVLWVFGAPLLDAFLVAINQSILSGQALNLPWIMTYYLQANSPVQYGTLTNGQAHYIFTTEPAIVLAPKLVFILSYALTFIAFLKEKGNVKAALKFSLIGFLAYFVFNTGVHENHLFLTAILAITLYWIDREYLPLMLFCIAMNIINPLLFLGLNGRTGLGFSRVVGIDVTVLFSAFNVIFFIAIWGMHIMPAAVAWPSPATENGK